MNKEVFKKKKDLHVNSKYVNIYNYYNNNVNIHIYKLTNLGSF